MKKQFIVIMVLGLLGAINNNAALVVQDNGATAEIDINAPEDLQGRQSAFTGTLKVIPSFGPALNSPDFPAYAANAKSKLKATGTLPKGTPSSPTDARLLERMTPENLMTWGNGTGGTVWWWHIATGKVSLGGIVVTLRSGDPGNILGKMVSFSGSSYSELAPGIRTNGSEITSGPASQEVEGRVIVGVGSKSFTVNSSADALEVRNWFFQFDKWSLSDEFSFGGKTETFVLRKTPPSVSSPQGGTGFIVIAENNGDPRSYGVQLAPTVDGPWNSAGVSMKAGQQLNVAPYTDYPLRFARLVSP